MANAEDYAIWIVQNQDKKGTPEFETVSQAYKQARIAQGSDTKSNLVTGQEGRQRFETRTQILPNQSHFLSAPNQPNEFDPAQGQGVITNTLAGYGKAYADQSRGIAQASYDLYAPLANFLDTKNTYVRKLKQLDFREEQDEVNKRDAPLLNTASGKTGNISGNVATTLPYSVVPGSNTILGGTLLGGYLGATQPVGTNESRTNNTLFGSAAGGTIPTLTKAYRFGKSALEPFYDKGQQKIIGRVIDETLGQDRGQVLGKLQGSKPLVPGTYPTAAEVSGNANLASLERAASATNPAIYDQARRANNQARIDFLRGLQTGNTEQLIADRSKAVAPLLQTVSRSDELVNTGRTVSLIDRIIKANSKRTTLVNELNNVRNTLFDEYPLTQRGGDAWKAVNDVINNKSIPGPDFDSLKGVRTILDRVRKGAINQDEALAQLKAFKTVGNDATDVLDLARQYLKTPDFVVSQNPQALKSASQNIGDLLNKRGPTGEKLNEAIARELTLIKKSLDNQIGKAEPAYKQFLQTFKEKSLPINQNQVLQEIEERSVNPVTETLSPFKFAQNVSDKVAAKVTGFKRARLERIFTPDQLTALNNLKTDLSRSQIPLNAGRGSGSDTVQKLAYTNLINQAGVPNFLRSLSPFNFVGNLVSRGGDLAYARANQELTNRLAITLLSPEDTAAALLRNTPPGPLLLNAQKIPQGLLYSSVPYLINSKE